MIDNESIKAIDNEIIKALGNCVKTDFISGCAECGMFAFDCKDKLIESALDIINRQQAEIENLKGSKSTRLKDIESTIDEFWTGLQQLSMFKGKEKPTLEELLEYIEQVKVEAYKEFAERLKKQSIEVDVSFGYGKEHYTEAVPAIEIDNLLAELTDNTFTKVDHNSLCETETYEGV